MASTADQALNQLYREHLDKFDRGAVRRKWRYQFVWVTVTSLTWLTLLLAILGTAFETHDFEGQTWLDRPVVNFAVNQAISAFGLLVIGLTVAQTTLGLQGRWLAYRAAAERLRRTCMLYRARLPPFDGADARTLLERTVADISGLAENWKARHFRKFFTWSFLRELLAVPPGKQPLPSTPDEGVAAGQVLTEAEVLDGRLRNQRRWYLRKSQLYARRYLLFQFLIVACSVANVLHVLLYHRVFWVVAVTTTVSLGLIACRDFLDWGPLFVRYRQTADNLKEIEDAYLRRKPPFDSPDAAEGLRRLTEQVEQTLSNEFQYWYVTRR
jgi:SMODS and SLOG-associating 2TM effector domain 1/Protein of unknown function (DUF4231)